MKEIFHFNKKTPSQSRGSFMIQMVPRGGIEPTTLSLEGFCSSTELPGHKKFFCLEFLDFDNFLFCEMREEDSEK